MMSTTRHLLLCLASSFCPLLLIDTNRSESESGVWTPTGYLFIIPLLHRSCKCLLPSPLYQTFTETGVLDHTISKTPALKRCVRLIFKQQVNLLLSVSTPVRGHSCLLLRHIRWNCWNYYEGILGGGQLDYSLHSQNFIRQQQIQE